MTQVSKTRHSKRAISIGQFTLSEGELRPRFSNRPPTSSSIYYIASASPQFQGFMGNKFGEEVNAKAY